MLDELGPVESDRQRLLRSLAFRWSVSPHRFGKTQSFLRAFPTTYVAPRSIVLLVQAGQVVSGVGRVGGGRRPLQALGHEGFLLHGLR